MKKLIGTLIAVILAVLVIAALPREARAQEMTGSCGENAAYVYDTDTKVLTISGTGPISDFANVNQSPFYSTMTIRNNCTTVIVGEGITRIGNYTFSNLSKVTSATLPSTLETIGNYAFNNCTMMTECVIPEGVTEIGESGFNRCMRMPSLTIPSTVTNIMKQAFNGWSLVTELDIPASVTTIGQSAFSGWTALEVLTLHEGLESIGLTAFGSLKITSVTIPASVTEIGYDAFSGCNLMTEYAVAEGNTVFCAADGMLYSADKTRLIDCPLAKAGAVTVDAACTEIVESAFSGCSSVTSIELPDTLVTIGGNAFESSGITSITVPESVTEMAAGVFSYCESLVSAEINANIEALPQYAFMYCYALESVELGENVGGYSYGSFSGCSSLTSVTVIEGITEIPESCFYGCSSLTYFDIPDTVTTIGSSAFSGCSVIDGIVLPAGLTSLGGSVFAQCSALTEMTIPEGITELPGSLFQMCYSLRQVIVLGDLTQSGAYNVIASNTFGRCSALENIIFRCPAPDKNKVNSYAFNSASPDIAIHFLPAYPEWETTRPLDVGGMSFSYVPDMAELSFCELRDRVDADGKKDIRIGFALTAVDGFEVTRRYVRFTCIELRLDVSVECPNDFSIGDGVVYFTAVLADIEEARYGCEFTVQAFIEQTKDDEATVGFTLPETVCITEMLNKD